MKSFQQAYKNLSKRQKVSFTVSVLARIFISVFDILGLGLIGMAASLLAGATVDPGSLTGKIILILSSMGLGSNLYAVFGLVAVGFFLGKSLLAAMINRWVSHFVSSLESNLTTKVFAGMLNSNLDLVEKLNQQEVLFGLQSSAQMAYGTLFTSTSIIIGEVALIIAVSLSLFVVSPFVFACLAMYFGLVGITMNQLINRRTVKLSREINEASIRTSILTQDMLQGFRQFVTSGHSTDLALRYGHERRKLSKASATTSTLAALPRYVTEIALMFGVAFLLIMRSSNSQILSPTTTTIFLAGAFRIIASMLPMQASITAVRQATEGSKLALEMTKTFGRNSEIRHLNLGAERRVPEGASLIKVRNLTYFHGEASKPSLDNVSAEFMPNTITALIGSSGAGKSTLVDLVLGLREPHKGEIEIDNVPARDFRVRFPGGIGYVPQETPLFVGSLKENLVMAERRVDEASLSNAIRMAALEDVVTGLPDGLQTQLGLNGASLSGGQVQRVGLARAFYQQASVLVFDEASSALDQVAVEKIYESILMSKDSATIIVIAHSKQVLDVADQILLMNSGRLEKIDKSTAETYFRGAK